MLNRINGDSKIKKHTRNKCVPAMNKKIGAIRKKSASVDDNNNSE